MGINWMDIGAAGRGAADAYYRYRDEENKADDAKFKKETQGRQRKKWQEEDAATQAYKSAPAVGTIRDVVNYKDATGQEYTGEDGPGMAPTTTRQEVTRESRMRGIADRLYAAGAGKEAAAAELQADQFRTTDRNFRVQAQQDAVLAKHAARVAAIQKGDQSVLGEMVAYYNTQVPDGKYLTIGSGPGGKLLMTYVDEKTNKPIGSKALSLKEWQAFAAQASKDMADHELSTTSMERLDASNKLGIDRENLNINRGKLGVLEREAAVRELLAPSTTTYQDRLGRAALQNAKAHAEQVGQNKFAAQPGAVFFNPETKQYEIRTQVVDRTSGEVKFVTQPIPPGWAPQKQASERTPEELAAVKLVGDAIKAGTVDPKKPGEVEAMYRMLGVDPTRIMGEDKTIAALIAGGKPSERAGVKPGGPATGGKNGIKPPESKSDSKEDPRVPSKTSNSKTEFTGGGAMRVVEPAKKDDKKPERRATIEYR